MRVQINCLPEPDLQFGEGAIGWEPKRMLATAGPWSETGRRDARVIRLGLVGFAEQLPPVRNWFMRMHRLILSPESNAKRNRPYPGLPTTFDAKFELSRRFERVIDPDVYGRCFDLSPTERFERLLDLFVSRVETLAGDLRPDCVIICLPEELAEFRISNPRLTIKEQAILEQLQRDEDREQLSLFQPTAEELKIAADLKPQASELLFRSFYRALKARCMMLPNPIPTQILRRQAYIEDEAKQSASTRAWNLSVSLFYKSGSIPWRPAGLAAHTCFMGITFHHLKRRSGDMVYASVAQAFSSESEPFALQGAAIPRDQVKGRQPYLKADQASTLVRRVIDEYEKRNGVRPTRVIVHKTSRYQLEEEQGFRSGLLDEVPACDLVWLAPTGFRLLRRGMQEPWRGTLCSIGNDSHYLFTTGFVPGWDEYPGPHIPAPLEIGSAGPTDIVERAREILALTKMNWNNAEGLGASPITLSFARRVGIVMTELGEDVAPNPLYRYYM